MREPPQIRLLPDGRRLYLHDGPIDLIIEAFAEPEQIGTAYRAAARRFVTILEELCGELTFLRQRMYPDSALPRGVVARRMALAVTPFAERCFITPMAAVAGAVAEEILEAMTSAALLERAYVNNGGDIAIHLTAGQEFTVGMVERPDRPSLFGTATIHAGQCIGGIATSGWRGRSFSLGIADAVTVLAENAAAADAAATVIANAVDVPGHPAVLREPACNIDPQSDLGNLPVTRYVGQLDENDVEIAVDSGDALAHNLIHQGLIHSAALSLQGLVRISAQTDYLRQIAQSGTLTHA